jgi:ribonuclease HI
MVVYHGLVLAWGLGIKELLCYSDSKTVIKLIYDLVNAWHHYAAIILNIKDLLARDWRVKVVVTTQNHIVTGARTTTSPASLTTKLNNQ